MHLASIREVGKSHPGKISQSMLLVIFLSQFFFFYTVAVSITTFEKRTASNQF